MDPRARRLLARALLLLFRSRRAIATSPTGGGLGSAQGDCRHGAGSWSRVKTWAYRVAALFRAPAAGSRALPRWRLGRPVPSPPTASPTGTAQGHLNRLVVSAQFRGDRPSARSSTDAGCGRRSRGRSRLLLTRPITGRDRPQTMQASRPGLRRRGGGGVCGSEPRAFLYSGKSEWCPGGRRGSPTASRALCG
jgi:hypothetical protein